VKTIISLRKNIQAINILQMPELFLTFFDEMRALCTVL